MIREIINFTENLIEDIPDIMQWKVQPSKGLHVFIDIDENGQWVNQNLQKGKDYDYYDGKSDLTQFIESIKPYFINSLLVDNDMNKCLDNDKCRNGDYIYPIKQIQSCSPYVVGFKRKDKEQDIEIANTKKTIIKYDRFEVIVQRSIVYLSKACLFCSSNTIYKNKVSFLSNKINDIISVIKSLNVNVGKKEISVYDLSKGDFIMIYLKNIPIIELEQSYNKYLTNKLFLKNEYNSEKNISDETFGLSFYKNNISIDKMFLKHLTGFQYMGINNRLSSTDVKTLYKFVLLSNNNVLPNPLPIFIDKNEITEKIIKIFSDIEFSNYRYAEMIKNIFEERTELQKYYLLNRQGGTIVDFDFVTQFRYFINTKIYNFTELKNVPSKTISNIFELERILSDMFLKYNNNNKQGFGFLIGNYFGNKIESKKEFKNFTVTKETLLHFYKFRKGIYDYIYKSNLESFTSEMFDNIVYSAILSDISMDDIVNEKHTKFYVIREKINIWFSLYNLFTENNNKISTLMISKIEKLKEKIREVAENEQSHIESDEEFAFAAGQVVSHLLEKSESGNKTYAMLEPFLQKRVSGLLQSEITKTIEIYNHNIKFYNGKKYGFEFLSADVLTYDESIRMEPLRKYFIAGCFCPSILWNQDNNLKKEI